MFGMTEPVNANSFSVSRSCRNTLLYILVLYLISKPPRAASVEARTKPFFSGVLFFGRNQQISFVDTFQPTMHRLVGFCLCEGIFFSWLENVYIYSTALRILVRFEGIYCLQSRDHQRTLSYLLSFPFETPLHACSQVHTNAMGRHVRSCTTRRKSGSAVLHGNLPLGSTWPNKDESTSRYDHKNLHHARQAVHCCAHTPPLQTQHERTTGEFVDLRLSAWINETARAAVIAFKNAGVRATAPASFLIYLCSSGSAIVPVE